MINLPVVSVVTVEKEVDNEYFKAAFSRQSDGKLYGHITFKVWSPSAKKETIRLLDSIDEPVYAILHDTKMFKFLTKLGFVPTGNLVSKALPGREDHIFGEVVRLKTDLNQHALQVYSELGREIMPISMVDGYGKVKVLEDTLTKYAAKTWTTKHHFSHGVYTRETLIPNNTLWVGFRHRNKTNCTIATGAITLLAVDKLGYATDLGTVSGPTTFVTEAGLQKVGYTHEDSVILNSFSLAGLDEKYHNEESLDILEDFVFEREE